MLISKTQDSQHKTGSRRNRYCILLEIKRSQKPPGSPPGGFFFEVFPDGTEKTLFIQVVGYSVNKASPRYALWGTVLEFPLC